MNPVLVVDDDDDTRSLYRRVLTMRGYEVIEASSVEEALEMLALAPRAIVLDLELADGTSTKLLDELTRDKNAPPVVLCTSSELGARVGHRYHITAIGKLALTAIGDEVDRIIEQGRRPRISRISMRGEADSRPSMDT